MNKRIIYIDIYKSLLMMLVIIGHLQFFDYNSRTLTLIYSFHMPAFLIIAGYLSNTSNESTFIDIIKKRFTSSIIPYFVFYFISLIILPKDTNKGQQIAVLTMFRGIGDPINSSNLPLWFLTYYFMSMTSFEILDLLSIKLSSRLNTKHNLNINKNLLLLIFCSIFIYLTYVYARVYKLERLPFNTEIALFSLLYIYIGKIFRFYQKIIFSFFYTTIQKKYLLILYIILYIIISFLWYKLSLKNGRIDLNARDYKNALLMYINAILGFIMFSPIPFVISKIKYIKDLFSFLGRISLYTLAYHIPSNIVTYGIINPFLPISFHLYLMSPNIISLSYFTLTALLFSSIMFFIHKDIFKKAL